jgi:hypothetical protein
MSTTYRVLDANFVLKILCKVAGATTDISWATSKYVKLKNPKSGVVTVLAASFTTDGTDGFVQATVTAAILAAPGQWRVSPLLLGASDKRREGTAIILEVQPNL